jgi:hypothetical protein
MRKAELDKKLEQVQHQKSCLKKDFINNYAQLYYCSHMTDFINNYSTLPLFTYDAIIKNVQIGLSPLVHYQ